MGRTRIKICGVRDEETAWAAADAGADAIGLVFVRSSPRYIDPEAAAALMMGLPPFLSTVALFMNPSLEHFCDAEETCPTTYVQFHGNEDEALVRRCGPGLIKAVRFDKDTIADDLARWDGVDEVDAILVDGGAGGEGVAFEWNRLAELVDNLSKPIVLAGGLTPDNVAEAIRVVRPYAVDVSSGVEKERGVKDPALVEAFCRAVLGA
ncbi:MAG: phosphoribosylanthranilate isomerase [Phycisphaerae bacterium]|nr:phosphoribosylanthranilate isomerase [Phycisphaerae bacterium]